MRVRRTGISRREFITGGIAAGVLAAGSVDLYRGRRHAVAADGGAAIAPVDVVAPAVRGDRMQATPLPPFPRNWWDGQFVRHVDTEQRVFAFTLDDGPSPYNTDKILRALEAYGAKATFFVVGVNARAWPDILRRTHDAGHQIGNHSVYHTPYSASALAQQIEPNQQIIESIIGVRPTVARAPGFTRGASYLAAAAAAGVYELHTDWYTTDSQTPRPSAWTIYLQHVNGLHRGGVEVNHDGGGPRPTPAAFPDMVAYSVQHGYTPVTADDLMVSGTPLPLSGYYPADVVIAADTTGGGTCGGYGDACDYDAYADLQSQLDDLSLTRLQRSRIVEVLADMDLERAAAP